MLRVQPEFKEGAKAGTPGGEWSKKVKKGKGRGKNDRLSHTEILERLAKGGFDTRMYFSLQVG